LQDQTATIKKFRVEGTAMGLFDSLTDDDLVLDSLPDHVVATVEIRDKFLSNFAMGGHAGLEFLVSDLQRWMPGQTVRIAFLDGSRDLHGDIEEATKEITQACNLTFDFGRDSQGNYRRWTESDVELAAEIRVSFDKPGYFSLVGIDSVDRNVGAPSERVGGRPHQASLNLGGFAMQKPATWRGTVRHEFLHAVGFHHSHQNMRGPCEASFRWEDDPSYEPTRDSRGAFITDHNGRRPGIYTYLAGFPNFWRREKVNHNLKTEEDPALVAGPFDRKSVMLYRFPTLFYKTAPSICAPDGDGQSLSDGDRRGLQLLYPNTAGEVSAIVESQKAIQNAIERAVPEIPVGPESTSVDGRALLRGTAEAMRRKFSQ
jgi:hypothetical protein